MPVNGDSVQLQIDVLLIAAEAHAVGPGQIGVRIIDGTLAFVCTGQPGQACYVHTTACYFLLKSHYIEPQSPYEGGRRPV